MRGSRAVGGRWLVLVLGLALTSGPAWADARTLLARMAETMRTGAYEGTFVHQRADTIQTLSLSHAVLDGVTHERLRTLSGEPFEVIRVGDRITCVWPAASEAVVARRPEDLLPTESLGQLAELPTAYDAEIVGSERMTGREAHVVAIRPRDEARYGYRLWLGREDHLLLRSDLVGPQGAVLERMVFTGIRTTGSLPASRFEPEIDKGDHAEHFAATSGGHSTEMPAWRPARLPSGFEPVSHREMSIADNGQLVQHSVYSDGLASVSVFVEPAGADTVALEGLTYMGAVHAFGRRVGDHQVTVVGELPAETVRAIADSVRRHDTG